MVTQLTLPKKLVNLHTGLWFSKYYRDKDEVLFTHVFRQVYNPTTENLQDMCVNLKLDTFDYAEAQQSIHALALVIKEAIPNCVELSDNMEVLLAWHTLEHVMLHISIE